MAGYLKRLTIRNLVSPFGLAFVSYAVFLMAWAAPPSLYADFIGEPDILYLTPAAIGFYSLCTAVFLAGLRCFQLWRPTASAVPQSAATGSPLMFLLVPLAASTALCAASILVLNGKVGNLAGLLFAQQGALIKLAGASGQGEEGSWGYALTVHTGVLWWAY